MDKSGFTSERTEGKAFWEDLRGPNSWKHENIETWHDVSE